MDAAARCCESRELRSAREPAARSRRVARLLTFLEASPLPTPRPLPTRCGRPSASAGRSLDAPSCVARAARSTPCPASPGRQPAVAASRRRTHERASISVADLRCGFRPAMVVAVGARRNDPPRPRPRLSAFGLAESLDQRSSQLGLGGADGGAYRGAISGGLNGPALSAPACLQPSRARLNTAASSLPAAWLRLARQQSHARWRRLLRATIGRSPVFRLFDSAVAVAAAVPADLQRGCSLARAGVQQACGRSVG